MAVHADLDSKNAAAVLARLAYGSRAALGREGVAGWLDEQLAAPAGDDPATAARLRDATFRIHYAAKDTAWAAVDEMRPLRTLDQPIDALWPLLDHDRFDAAERRRPVQEVIAA